MQDSYEKDDDKKSLRKVSDVKTKLKRYREQFEKLWRDEDEAYYGDIWKNKSEFRPYENHLFSMVEREVPILTDSQGTVTFKTHKEDIKEQVSVLSKSVDWVLKQQDIELKKPMVIRNSLISAPGYLHTYYDANANNGEGEVKIEVLPWKQVYLSGEALFPEDCESARLELKRSKSWLKLNYPNYKEKIDKLKAEDDIQYESSNDVEKYDTGGYARRSVPKEYKDENVLTLVKTYVKDYEIEPISLEETQEEINSATESLQNGEMPDTNKWQNHKAHIEYFSAKKTEIEAQIQQAQMQSQALAPEQVEELEQQLQPIIFQLELIDQLLEAHEFLAKENPEGGKLKYKNGLRVIETVQECLLYDGESRDEHCEIPIIPYWCYRDGTIYGHGEIRHTLDSQRMHATMTYKEYKGLKRVANPRIIVDEETGLTEDEITNDDGAIYIIPQGTNIRDDAPGQVSPQLNQFAIGRQQNIQDISGMNEATEGKMPSPDASGVSIERTQQQAIGRVRLKDRQNQLYSTKRLGKLVAQLIIQYWTEEKTFALDSGDNYEEYLYSPLEMEALEYEVEAAPGSMAGVDKSSYNYMLSTFLSQGHITFDQFLQVAEIPKKEKLRELIDQQEQLQQQLQALQQENIKLKAQASPELLTDEEKAMWEEMVRQESLQQQMGVTNDQPI